MIADKLLNGCEYSSKHFEILPIPYFHHVENLPQCMVHLTPPPHTHTAYGTLLSVQIVLYLEYSYLYTKVAAPLQNCNDF